MSSVQEPHLHLEVGHILFLDIVGYSKLLADEQKELVQEHSFEQSRRHPGDGGRDERWRKFVGSISRLESFSSKRLTKKFVAKV